MGRLSQVPPLYVAGHHVRIPVSFLWVMQCPQGLYQASIGTATSTKGSCHNVTGRYTADGPMGRTGRTTGANHIATGRLMFCGQQGETPLASYPVNTISGISGQLTRNVNQAN